MCCVYLPVNSCTGFELHPDIESSEAFLGVATPHLVVWCSEVHAGHPHFSGGCWRAYSIIVIMVAEEN
jgi:hypothetical protein